MMGKNVVLGFFLLEDLAFVRSRKGEPGIKKISSLVKSIDIATIKPLRKYPLRTEIELLHAAATVIFGVDSPEAWEALGRINFESTKNSSFGKTLVSLLGKNPRSLIPHATKIFTFFAPFIHFSYAYISENSVAITLEPDPYPKEYFLGSLRGFVEFIGSPATVTVQEKGPIHIYTIVW